MIELKRGSQEKRARRILTRPEPTIFGNCDSWNFIVGKKGTAYSPKTNNKAKLRGNNMKFIHSLLTIKAKEAWTTCGRTVERL
ncbi:MAG: hypothetical protein IPO43_22215 [Rhodoferax sp.]|nr:hypothetical protein [Rhodoferax sp.]